MRGTQVIQPLGQRLIRFIPAHAGNTWSQASVVGRPSNLLVAMTHATILPITSELRPNISLRIDLAPTVENGLQTASQVMVDWPQTIELSTIGAVIGQLNATLMRNITRQMAIVLGIGADRLD